MFGWLTRRAREEAGPSDRAVSGKDLVERLHRIAADHMPDGRSSIRQTTTVPLLLPAPDHRREFIGRYDWSRRTMFPFDEQLWSGVVR